MGAFEGMDTGQPEGLIDVNVTQPRQERLIQKQRLDHASMDLQIVAQPVQTEAGLQRLRAETIRKAPISSAIVQ